MAEENKNGKKGAVLVLGGGVAGMQSAIDLADSGYYVYLAEKSPYIGGKMAQLDKTFPTNDCAMCTISPRLVGVGRHLNIEIVSGVELIRVEGEAGNFKAYLRQNERLVDPAKCTACGDCKEVCPVEVDSEFDLGLTKRTAVYKSYSQAVPNAYAIDKKGFSACKVSCPAGISVQGYIALIAKGKYKEAYNLIMKNNPLPGVCGRMCHHPCESDCKRGLVDEAVSIRNLRRFLADRIYGDPGFMPPQAEVDTQPEKIAIIGAGPSGLSCAYYLTLEGYSVEIFEALPVKGGMLSVGIPEYRVPADSLAVEISNIEALGVKIHTNTRVGKDIPFSKLMEDFDAVYIAAGAHLANRLNIPGVENEDVIEGVGFLRKVSLGEEVPKGKKAVVIGGGNVALDVARTALRIGFDVSLMCLESEEEIPCHPWELEEAIEEGVKVNYSLGPKEIIVKDGSVRGVKTIKVKSVFDGDGRFSPEFYEGTEDTMEGDKVFLAIGQRPDLSFLESYEWQIGINPGNTVKVDPSLLCADEEKIYAGGDVVRGPASAIEAIADGRRAAMVLDSKFRGKPVPEDVRPEPTEPDLESKKIKKQWKKVPSKLSAEERIKDFREIEKPFSEDDALAEALRCLHCSVCSDCRLCVEACGPDAISHDGPVQTVKELDVGAIILSPGFEYYDVNLKEEFGHQRYKNVLSSLEFERILSAGGPFMGEINRLSDGQHPKKIAWIQCVGSRDEDRDYCSSVCCMYATKQARLVKEHLPDTECTIFFIDLRAFGKGFDDYCIRAEGLGVKYVRCRPSSVKEDPLTQNLLFQYVSPEGKLLTDEFEMIILSGGLGAGKEQKEVADTLNIELNEFEFCNTDKWNPLNTNREGIYTCGAFTEPKDIPESVTQASGAAALAIELLKDVRNTCTKTKEYPDEKDISKEEPRVGVFVCRCGTNIGGVIEVPSVVDYVKDLPEVVFAEENMYTCAADSLEKIKEMIKEHDLNRVVVTSCTPRTHEPLFQEALREAGLNPYLFEMANIRDQCTWVHSKSPDKALDKAKTLAQMAVMRARKLNPLYNQDIDICRDVLVIGGGIAGMTSALSLAKQGFRVIIIEKDKDLGGLLRDVKFTVEGKDPAEILSRLKSEIESNGLISIYYESVVEEVRGFMGNFDVKVSQRGNGGISPFKCGVVIVATGGKEYRGNEYLYGESEIVKTQLEFENILKKSPDEIRKLKRVAMIQCVGSRNDERPYCSRVCCTEAVKNALKIKEISPDTEVIVYYRDIRTFGFREKYYTQARKKGVVFICFNENEPPEVSQEEGAIKISVKDRVLGEKVSQTFDMLLLSMAIVPYEENKAVSDALKIPLTAESFFLEAHMKLKPVDFASEGIFLCGMTHFPKFMEESIAQALAVSGRANTILAKDKLHVGGSVAVVDENKCASCLTCVRTCPYQVPKVLDRVAHIEVAQCQGCGTCTAECPNKAIQLLHYTDEQVIAKCDSFNLEEREAKKEETKFADDSPVIGKNES